LVYRRPSDKTSLSSHRRRSTALPEILLDPTLANTPVACPRDLPSLETLPPSLFGGPLRPGRIKDLIFSSRLILLFRAIHSAKFRTAGPKFERRGSALNGRRYSQLRCHTLFPLWLLLYLVNAQEWGPGFLLGLGLLWVWAPFALPKVVWFFAHPLFL